MENKVLQIASDYGQEQAVEIVAINTICRLCASQNERLIGIFSEEGISNDLSNKINSYLPVKVAVDDGLPLQCCWSCTSTLLTYHELVLRTVETDKKLKTLQVLPEKQDEDDGGFDCPTSTLSDDNEEG